MNWMKYRYTGCRKIFHHSKSTETDRSRFLSISSSHQRPASFKHSLTTYFHKLTSYSLREDVTNNSKFEDFERPCNIAAFLSSSTFQLAQNGDPFVSFDRYYLHRQDPIDDKLRWHRTSLTLDFSDDTILTDDKNRSTQRLTDCYKIVSCVCNDPQDLHTNVDKYARFFTGINLIRANTNPLVSKFQEKCFCRKSHPPLRLLLVWTRFQQDVCTCCQCCRYRQRIKRKLIQRWKPYSARDSYKLNNKINDHLCVDRCC